MESPEYIFSVFTKPWKNMQVEELGKLVRDMGFDAIEFPLRKGFQVEPDNAEKGLPQLAVKLNEFGIKITSVAATLEEKVFAGCAAAGIPVIRIMFTVDPELGYMACEEKAKRELEKVLPLCEKYGVKVGVQQHFGFYVNSSMEVRHLIEDFDPKHIGAIWDAAHSGLAGEEPEQALDILWSHLCMVNLKNAFYKRVNGPEAGEAVWHRYFTTGPHGLCSWSRAVRYLKKRGYQGVICLTAEYDDENNVVQYCREDLKYIKSLLEESV